MALQSLLLAVGMLSHSGDTVFVQDVAQNSVAVQDTIQPNTNRLSYRTS